jgi:hypothetical protein
LIGALLENAVRVRLVLVRILRRRQMLGGGEAAGVVVVGRRSARAGVVDEVTLPDSSK